MRINKDNKKYWRLVAATRQQDKSAKAQGSRKSAAAAGTEEDPV
jgi:hypothetical protein